MNGRNPLGLVVKEVLNYHRVKIVTSTIHYTLNWYFLNA